VAIRRLSRDQRAAACGGAELDKVYSSAIV
jgi:hypothetical protein